jgi:hypothetical protein
MPHVLRPRGLRATIGSLLGAAALLAAPAAANAACASTPTTTPFTPFGDSAKYSLVSNGAFESGTTGWSLTGASVAGGNETWRVHGASDAKSLAITSKGVAVSPAFCVDVDRPTFRFFARRTSGTWGVLNVRLRWRTGNGAVNETTVAAIDGSSTAWQVTPVLNLATTLPLWNGGQNATVQLVFDPEDYGGNWAIDDVYIDPYVRG